MAAVFHKVVRELSSLRYPLAATRIALRGLCALASCFYLRQRPDFYGNSFVDFGTCCYTYNPSIVAVAKSSIAAVLFSPISKRFICLFFLLPHKAASHTGDFYRTFFQESLFRAACLPASLELSRDFYRENFGVVKSICSTLSSFFFTFCFIIGWFLATFSLPLPFPPSSRSVQHFFGHFFRDS